VQTDDYLDRPQTPLFWPEKSGIDKMTEIIDGDLFKCKDWKMKKKEDLIKM